MAPKEGIESRSRDLCYGDAKQRLRFAFQLVKMLAEKEDATVIQSWLTGLNPELGDRFG